MPSLTAFYIDHLGCRPGKAKRKRPQQETLRLALAKLSRFVADPYLHSFVNGAVLLVIRTQKFAT